MWTAVCHSVVCCRSLSPSCIRREWNLHLKDVMLSSSGPVSCQPRKQDMISIMSQWVLLSLLMMSSQNRIRANTLGLDSSHLMKMSSITSTAAKLTVACRGSSDETRVHKLHFGAVIRRHLKYWGVFPFLKRDHRPFQLNRPLRHAFLGLCNESVTQACTVSL